MKTILTASFGALALALMTSSYMLADGATDFKAKCAPCHGASGSGDTAMGKNLKIRDLGSADVQGQSDTQLADIIGKGKGKMPSYDGKLSKDQINDLVKYIRTLKK